MKLLKNPVARGMFLTILGGICWGVSGTCGQFLFSTYGVDAMWLTSIRLLSGGLLLGAFFMATDYVTSPVTPWGQVVYAFGCGLLVAVIRTFGGYAEGVCFSILIMNLATPLIERICRPRIYGEVKE